MAASQEYAADQAELTLRDVVPLGICATAEDTKATMIAVNGTLEAADLGHLKAFGEVYLKLTSMVADGVALGPRSEGGIFDEPETVDRTVGMFADYWFRQLRGHLGIDGNEVDPAWQLLFYDPRVKSAEPGIQFLLGMNAHINYDLPQALRDSNVGPGYRRDYDEVIGMLIDQTANELDNIYIPGPELSRNVLRDITVAMIADWREDAWQSGMVLIQAEELKRSGMVEESDIALGSIMRVIDPEIVAIGESVGDSVLSVLNRESMKTGEFILSKGRIALGGLARAVKYQRALRGMPGLLAGRARQLLLGQNGSQPRD